MFRQADDRVLPLLPDSDIQMEPLVVAYEVVYSIFMNLYTYKAAGPDGLHPKIL